MFSGFTRVSPKTEKTGDFSRKTPIFSVLWKEVEVLNETAAMMLGFVCGFIVGAWISSRLSYLLNMLEGRLLERERRAEEKEEG